MAVFTNSTATAVQIYMRETQDHMFIRGQAHSKATLKPIYGVQHNTIANVNPWAIQPNNSNFAFGIDAARTTSMPSGSGCFYMSSNQHALNGFVLKRTIPVGGGDYYLSNCGDTSANGSRVYRINSKGDATGLSSPEGESFFLFDNTENTFIYSAENWAYLYGYSGLPTSSYRVFSVHNKETNTFTSHISYSGIAHSGSSSSPHGRTVTSLIGVDESEKTADVVRIAYGINITGHFDFASSFVDTLNGKEGTGTVSSRAIQKPTNFLSIAYTTINSSWTKTRPQVTRKITGSDGKKYFFWYDSSSAYMGNGWEAIYCMGYDESIPGSPVTGTAVQGLDFGTTKTSSYESGSRIRIIERDTHFFVVLCKNLFKQGATVPSANNALVIEVYRGTYDKPEELTRTGRYVGSDVYTCYDVFDMSGDFSQLALMHMGSNSQIATLNEVTGEYFIQATLDYRIKQIMTDDLNRTWILTHTNALHLQGPSVGNTVKVGFEDVDLEYKGQQINTNLLASCYNYLGERVANNITVQLEGGVSYFSSNGETSITLMTSAAGDIPIPITISGNGYVRVVANMAL